MTPWKPIGRFSALGSALKRIPPTGVPSSHVTVVPNISARYSYFVDAETSEVLSYHTEICKIAGHLHIADRGLRIADEPASPNKKQPVHTEQIVAFKSLAFLSHLNKSKFPFGNSFNEKPAITIISVGKISIEVKISKWVKPKFAELF